MKALTDCCQFFATSCVLRVTFVVNLFLVAILGSAEAQLTILHHFGDGSVPNDGAGPDAGVVEGANGNFYGATLGNVTPSKGPRGTIFQITSSGTVTILHIFKVSQKMNPTENLLFYNQRLIGTTADGGSKGPGHRAGFGTVFATKLTGSTSLWHEFGDGTVSDDGTDPKASLILGSDGNLYGTTFSGGAYGQGTIFKINPSGHKMSILYSFGGFSGDGLNPSGALLQAADGNFYGTTMTGGSVPESFGTIFQMTPKGKVTILYSFQAHNQQTGAQPVGSLIQGTDGNFYGVTSSGGTANWGTVFQMTPQYVVTVLHSFGQGTDGLNTQSGLVQATNTFLYGTTSDGGTAKMGIIYKISTTGNYTVLHNFGDGSIRKDGAFPVGPLTLGSDGSLYGTTSSQGSGGVALGTVFRISP